MRGCYAERFIFRIAHCRGYCLCRTTLARSYSCAQFTRNCARNRGGGRDWAVPPGGGADRSPDFNPLRAWGRFFSLFLRGGGRTCEGMRAPLVVCWSSFSPVIWIVV